jgi:uncharacterized protein with HEPN domain
MPPSDRDAAYLLDMLRAGQSAREFVSQDVQVKNPEIPWAKIVGQRNVLAHEYGEIRQELMYLLATEHIPDLIAGLVRILGHD